MEAIVNQIYKHYKGGIYQVLAIGVKHTERDEELVMYKCCDSRDSFNIFARPKSMFEEAITIDGVEVERFERISGGFRQVINTKIICRKKQKGKSYAEGCIRKKLCRA